MIKEDFFEKIKNEEIFRNDYTKKIKLLGEIETIDKDGNEQELFLLYAHGNNYVINLVLEDYYWLSGDYWLDIVKSEEEFADIFSTLNPAASKIHIPTSNNNLIIEKNECGLLQTNLFSIEYGKTVIIQRHTDFDLVDYISFMTTLGKFLNTEYLTNCINRNDCNFNRE